jgi:hypothetical protein
LAAPATGSTQCQACPDKTAAKVRPVGHALVDPDPEHPAAGRPELPGGYARAGTDVENVEPGDGADDPVHSAPGYRGRARS